MGSVLSELSWTDSFKRTKEEDPILMFSIESTHVFVFASIADDCCMKRELSYPY